MDDRHQRCILGVLAVLALLAGAGWGYTLANHPGPTKVAEPVPPVRDSTQPATYYDSVAKMRSRRWIRCDLVGIGPVTADAHLDEPNAHDDVLYAFVHSVGGSAMLKLADGTLKQALWRDAQPGGEGSCKIGDPEPVTLTGSVVGATGGIVVSSCSEVAVDVGPEGRFQVGGFLAHPCTVWFVGEGSAGDLLARIRLTPDGSMSSLVLQPEAF